MSSNDPTLSPGEGGPLDLFEPLDPPRPPRNPLLSAILYALVVTYALGAAGFLIVWESAHELGRSLPLYGLVFILGALSAVAVLKWKRWGVYGLAATWAATAILNAVFSQPVYPLAQVMGIALILGFFWLVRGVWPALD